jgi:hypothetical protein
MEKIAAFIGPNGNTPPPPYHYKLGGRLTNNKTTKLSSFSFQEPLLILFLRARSFYRRKICVIKFDIYIGDSICAGTTKHLL